MAKLLELYAQSCIPERENQSYLRPIEENFFKVSNLKNVLVITNT